MAAAARRRLTLIQQIRECEMRWAEEALQLAHGGDAEATLLLALCLLRGYGVPQNVDKAKDWMRKLAAGPRDPKRCREQAAAMLRRLESMPLDEAVDLDDCMEPGLS
eukprot:m.18528 g.18528  ORF g.18528 m.18528 type:complete len:107 (+) comp8195_c0_seq2:71-391(+)